MKSVIPLTLAACLSALSVNAQESTIPRRSPERVTMPEASPGAALRFPDARRLVRQGGGRVQEDEGVLVSDPQSAEIRFEQFDYAVYAVPYADITALHYENAAEPSKWGWPLTQTRHLLTIHYADGFGGAAAETVRLPDRDVPLALDALETDSGRTIDRTRARQSFLGIPIRAAIGDRVKIRNQAGEDVEGIITEISASSLALEGTPAGPRRFDAGSVTSIALTRSPRRDALRGFGTGALAGGIAGGLIGGLLGRDARSACDGAVWLGGFTGGAGALASALFPSYQFRAARNVYTAAGAAPSTPPSIVIAPRLEKERTGVLVSVRF